MKVSSSWILYFYSERACKTSNKLVSHTVLRPESRAGRRGSGQESGEDAHDHENHPGKPGAVVAANELHWTKSGRLGSRTLAWGFFVTQIHRCPHNSLDTNNRNIETI